MANTLSKFILALVAAFSLSAVTTSCDSVIYDELRPCETRNLVKFRYDYNMKFANAFAHEVEGVTLYVADAETGRVVKVYREAGQKLQEEDFAIELDVAPGKYTLLAWCGVANPTTFDIPNAENINGLTATMQRTYDDLKKAHRYEDLDRLYYGYVGEMEVYAPSPETDGTFVTIVSLIKDTNNIRIVLQQLSGEEMKPDDYDFEIVDANGAMNWNNLLLRPDENIIYHEWDKIPAMAMIVPDEDVRAKSPAITPAPQKAPESRADGVYDAVIAELTVPRLMADREEKALLRVRKHETGEAIISIRLIDALLLAKGYYNRTMSDQEYLDRKDDYPLTFFIKGDKWLNNCIYIESWKIVLQNVSL